MISVKKKPILVTGASSGIGYHLTKYLAERGRRVFATVRKIHDAETLNQVDGVVPLIMDVRDQDQIRDAFQTVSQTEDGLFGLVNNAGIGGLGFFSTWSDEDLYEIFDVNVFGVHRVTNAFLPLLVQSKGRIVNIGSQGGMITSKYYGPYTMTKHALEAYTQALNLELTPYGVWVSIVQPGGVVTRVGEKSMTGTFTRFQRAEAPFKVEAEIVLASFRRVPDQDDSAPESETNRKPSSPEIVSEAVYEALFSERPKLRYLVGTKWEGDRVINALLERLLDENDNPQHRYSRDELVALLDHHIKTRG